MTNGTDYRAILASDTPLIDVRAPVEFSQSAMPAAINLPLMNDEERAAVGTCYKRQGPEAALALGHKLVDGDLRASRAGPPAPTGKRAASRGRGLRDCPEIRAGRPDGFFPAPGRRSCPPISRS